VLGESPRGGNPRIGYVPQGSNFDPDLSIRGRDFVGLGVDGHRWGVRLTGRAHVAIATDASIAAVGALGYADRQLGRLSGGEQQRLLLAQALVGQPNLLLMVSTVAPRCSNQVRSSSSSARSPERGI
jgi:zinc/manganese transport system ATP-binding protein